MKRRIDWQNAIIPRAKEFIDSYSYRPTLRQIFYRLVATLLIPNTEGAYKSLSRVLRLARERGVIDPLALADRIRESHGGDYGWDNPEDFIEEQIGRFAKAWEMYARPLWTSQQTLPILWIEKDALYPAVTQIADRYRVKVYQGRGYSSFTQVYEAAKEFRSVNPCILFLSDFDPSGEDMPRDIEERLYRYGAGEFTLEKLALTREQVRDYGLPPMLAKKSDPRFKAFAESYGDRAVELDALPPEKLENIIVRQIENHIDATAWNNEIEKSDQERKQVAKVIQQLAKRLNGEGPENNLKGR